MERDLLDYALIAAGAVLLWLIYRRRRAGRTTNMAMIACAIAIAIAYLYLLQVWNP